MTDAHARGCSRRSMRNRTAPNHPACSRVASAMLALTGPAAGANEFLILPLHARVQFSDTIVLARVVDPSNASLLVERVLKGEPPKQITLASYVDPAAAQGDRKPLVHNAQELLFLNRKEGGSYAPLQNQYGRLSVVRGRISASPVEKGRRLSQTMSSIERLTKIQGLAARSNEEADAAYAAGLNSPDNELQLWALSEAN